MLRFVITSVLGAVIVACETMPPSAATNPAPSVPATAPELGRCEGTTPEPYRYADPDSCRIQGGDWDNTYLECHAKYSGGESCERHTPYVAARVESERSDCLALDGCVWHEADGKVVHAAWSGGTCLGTKVPCAQSADCKQTGCRVEDGVCKQRTNSTFYLLNEPGCAFSPSRDLNASVAHSECLRRAGCYWVAADGGIEHGAEP
ncbi:MAG: hypothetical protein IT381_23625 [Deltaproteobacteria bacterium]|nr:hypothetical protein [Deltaproteobacteria bacterium]